jgi:hypothetical protein
VRTVIIFARDFFAVVGVLSTIAFAVLVGWRAHMDRRARRGLIPTVPSPHQTPQRSRK